MIRRPKLWLITASVFTLINLAGAVYAAAMVEPLHATGHVVLMLIGGFLVWRLAVRSSQPRAAEESPAVERLDNLQQSLDAIAVEVERIGEHQRFITKIAAERGDLSPQQARTVRR